MTVGIYNVVSVGRKKNRFNSHSVSETSYVYKPRAQITEHELNTGCCCLFTGHSHVTG